MSTDMAVLAFGDTGETAIENPAKRDGSRNLVGHASKES